MKKIIFIALCSLMTAGSFAQNVSVRVSQSNYSAVDPDGAGLATGTVTLRFEMIATSQVDADGMGIGAAFQSASLMPAATNTIVALGPLAPLGWTISSNLAGNTILPGPTNYGGQVFDRTLIIGLSQGSTGTTCPITTSWTPIIEVTYWTKNPSFPQGGYTTAQPATVVPQHEVSADGGISSYPLLSPNFLTPVALGGTVPVLFSKFDAKCTNTGTLLSWATAQEGNSSRFEIERSTNGTTWNTVATVPAAGSSTSERNYQQLDLNGGTAFYRIKQIDKDGQFIYTGVEPVNCKVKNITSLIYPVPANDVLNVVIKSDRSIRTQLMVYDMKGTLVKKLDAPIVTGNNTFRINLIGLASGDYMLRSNDTSIEINKVFTITR